MNQNTLPDKRWKETVERQNTSRKFRQVLRNKQNLFFLKERRKENNEIRNIEQTKNRGAAKIS